MIYSWESVSQGCQVQPIESEKIGKEFTISELRVKQLACLQEGRQMKGVPEKAGTSVD